MTKFFLGVDPGASGSTSVLDAEGNVMDIISHGETERDVLYRFLRWVPSKALIERVHSMPRQGVASTFKFGQSYGFLRCCLLATGATVFEEVTPAVWQREMSCRSGGNKRVTKARAQQLFPQTKVTHRNADSLLLAECCRRRERADGNNMASIHRRD